MLCVVQVPNLSMAVPVRSNVASHSSAYSSLINQPAGLGLPVRLWERLGRRGYSRDNSTTPPFFNLEKDASVVATNPPELSLGHALWRP